MARDNHFQKFSTYYLRTKKVVLDFAEDASIPIHEEIPVEETVKLVFTDQGVWGGSDDN